MRATNIGVLSKTVGPSSSAAASKPLSGVDANFLFNYCIRYMNDTVKKHTTDLDSIVTFFAQQDVFKQQYASAQNEKVYYD
jgi:hypothetical protein